jgi:LysR family hydrogen peroxide-inducible transcriptional activator
MVDRSGGLTIIPELALHDFSPKRLKNVREFMAPAPVREISIIYNREQVKTRMIEVLENEILAHIPEGMKRSSTDVLVL